jgi:hypothetical protein
MTREREADFMIPYLLRGVVTAGHDQLLDALTARQHTAPHEPLAESLAHLATTLGVCPGAIEQALVWLAVDPQTSVGRLRRTELTQLARSIHRMWRQRVAQQQAAESDAAPSASPPSERQS